MLLVSVLLLNVGVIIAQLLNPDKCGVNIVIEKHVRPPSLVKNGENTNGLGVWPWVCSVGFVENDSWDHQCGGTLITYRHILTAAHCPTSFRKRADRIIVRCGDYHLKNATDNQEVQIQRVTKFKNHERYGYFSAHYDIAILYFENDFKATKYVRPICLQSPTELETQEPAIVVGWGKDENGEAGNELKETTLQILGADTCETRVGKVTWIKYGFGDDLFCAVDPKGWTVEGGGSGSGKGDSGGPIFSLKTYPSLRYELKGLVNAGTRKIPDIYTRTGFPKIYKWIVDNVECSDGQHCVSEESDLLYLGAKTVHLPSFTPLTTCATPKHPTEGLYAAVTVLVNGGGIMTCGGQDAYQTLSSCHSLKGPEWTQEPNMIERRSGAASCNTPTGGMFVTGGSYLPSTEYFSGQWIKGPDLPEVMFAHCQVYTSSGVIVTGGWNTRDNLATVLRLDGNTWTTLPSINRARRYHSCAYYKEQVVVMGGFDSNNNGLLSVEILNIDTLKWTIGPSLPRKVYYGLSTIYADVLYLVSQDGEVMSLSDYNNEWQEVANIGSISDRVTGVLTAQIVTPSDIGC